MKIKLRDLNSKLWGEYGLNTFKPCKIVENWTLYVNIMGLPQATKLERSLNEILVYMA